MNVQRSVTALIWILVIAAAGCAAAGCVPYSVLQPLGALLRRPDDVTPERYARYLHVCWFFAVACGIAALLVRKFRRDVDRFLRDCLAQHYEPVVAEPDERVFYVLTLLLITVGLLLRWSRLFDPMAYDEAYTFLNFARRSWIIAIADYNSTNNHLLNTFLMHWSYRLLGDAEWALRLPVFLAGGLTLVMAARWSRPWFSPRESCLVTAMVAVSPMLITYSANARGYMFIAAATLVLDAALWKMHCSPARSARATVIAWCAVVAGCWSMPIMLYGVIACCGWYVLVPIFERPLLTSVIRRRARILVVLLGTAALVVMAGYAPSYVFRGLLFLQDPIMQPDSGPYAQQLADSWKGAYLWWTDGAVPAFVWLPLAIVGLFTWPRTAEYWLRWLSPFLVVLVINVAQGVAPPPRIYMFLAPWFYLTASRGITRLIDLAPDWRRGGVIVTGLALAIAGTVYTVRHPVLFDPADRTSYVSIRNLIEHLEEDLADEPNDADRLIAPLPADLPSIFYLERAGLTIPVNGEPLEGETVWLITRHGESPEEVLTSTLVGLNEFVDRFEPWQPVASFRTLELHRSSLR